LTRDGREVFGSGILRGARPRSLPGGEVGVEDNNRKNVTVAEAAEYLGLSRSTVQEMVDRGVLEAERFAGAVHIPREEVERIERESAP
jgi:excisionase family DNA binding protein